MPQVSPLLAQPQYNPQIPPQWQQQAPSVQSNPSKSNSELSQILHEQREYFKFMQAKEEACKECKKQREEREKRWKEDNNTKVHTNKAFEKIEKFDGSNPE